MDFMLRRVLVRRSSSFSSRCKTAGFSTATRASWFVLIAVMASAGIAQGDLPGYQLAYRIDSQTGFECFGFSQARVADVSGDGKPDLVVGCPGAGYGNSTGHVFLMQLSQNGLTTLSRIDALSGNNRLGSSVCGLTDVNGDGIPDYASGAPSGQFVVWGSGANRTVGGSVSSHPGVIANVPYSTDVYYFGTSLAGLSNGQLVEASRPQTGGTGACAIWYKPSGGGVQVKLKIQAQESWRNDPVVLNVGDQVGHDGIDDFLIATDDCNSSAGRVSLVSGALTNTGMVLLKDIESCHFDGPATETVIGDISGYGYKPLATAGDFTGDGVMDYVFTASRSHSWTGAAYLYDGATHQMLWEIPRPTGVVRTWYSVENVGDIDRDGKDDLAIMMEKSGQTDEVYFYSPAKQQYIGYLDGQSANDNFGFSIQTLGDINGDGQPDFAIGAPRADFTGTDTGSLYVYTSVPEPTALGLLGLGGLALIRRRK